MDLTLPRRVSLASLPTRVTDLKRLSDELGGPLIRVKRDDQTGIDLSGNKVRKLEYLLADAQDQGCTTVITCGAVQSNHCRATAVACRTLGMDSLLLLRGEPPDVADGNLLLDRLVGARLEYISDEEWKRRHEVMSDAAAGLAADGEKPYVIPEGGSNGLGAWGYISMTAELLDEEDRCPYTHIVCALGSGGTLAGLLLGRRILNVSVEIWAVNVSNDADYFRRRVDEIADEFNARHGSSFSFSPRDYRILDGYKGPGYGIPYDEQLACMRHAARTEALFLDPVYTGKAFYALVDRIGKGEMSSGDRPLFVHTGGLFGLFPHRDKLFSGKD